MLTPVTILTAAGTMLALAVAMSLVLGWANRAFHVETDPRVDAAVQALPGANCGGCGYVGCSEYAEAVVLHGAPVDLCPVGGLSTAEALAEIMGVGLEEKVPERPVVHCNARLEDRLGRHAYEGEESCAAANMVAGVQGCAYGCLGFGDCVEACPFDAIHLAGGLARVDYEKCVGCGACAKVCPRKVISMVPFRHARVVVVKCSNKDFGPEVKKVCKVGCIGCKACERAMGEYFRVEDNLARADPEKFDPGLDFGPVLEKCPQEGIVFLGLPGPGGREDTAPGRVESDFRTTVDKAAWRG